MGKKYLIIGPSGIGKSTAISQLLNDNSLEAYDLDCLIKEIEGAPSITAFFDKVQPEQFFNISKRIIEGLNREKPILIAVGAGSFSLPGSHSWFLNQNTIALVGDPLLKIYPRCERQNVHKTAEAYKMNEYSGNNAKLYTSCKHKIDVTELSPQEVAMRITEIIKVQ